jgi:hypothetical protein
MKAVDLILAAATVGVLAMAFAGTVFVLLEERWPILHDFTGDQKDIFNRCFRRAMFCVWITAGLLYIALTYWWRN